MGTVRESQVLQYFRKFPVLSSSKKKNFSIFCAIAKLMEKGEHKNWKGLKKILELREKINEGKGRTRKYGINDVFLEQESSETIRSDSDLIDLIGE